MFKKIFLTIVVLAILVFGGVSVYVSTIDWNLHKNKIAKQFEEISGKKIVFEGPVSLSFFPAPYLSAKDIKIFNQTGENTTQPLAVVKEMVTDIGLIPLLKGQFSIDNMSLIDANISIEFMPDGKLNWYSQITENQRDKIDAVQVELNSVLLKNAVVQIINEGLGVNIELKNLNAEVMAESLFGPYRIDGNFVKDNNPAGFALNLGTLNENFATSLNLVLTHPNSESYARFDGSMLSSNKEIKGNLHIDSKKPSSFINSLTNQVIIPTEYSYPLECTIELITNETQIDLSSFIIKYGDKTAGAGNILIPLVPEADEEKRKIEAAFEMTGIDLTPIIGIFKQHFKKYENKGVEYTPDLDFDLIADITSVQAHLNNQTLRNVIFSANLINDVVSIKELSASLPGNTEMKITGDVFESDKLLSYAFNVKAVSQDVYKFMEAFNIQPPLVAQATYKNAAANIDVSGNLQQIKTPFKLQVDKTNAEGVIDIIRGERKNLSLSVNADNINFDNYVSKLPESEKKLTITEKITKELNRLKFLNDYDITMDAKIATGIYNAVALEDLTVSFTTDKTDVKISNIDIKNFNNAEIQLSGNIQNIGTQPNFKNVKYSLKTDKLSDLTSKLGLDISKNQFLANAKNVKAKGIFTGNLKNANIKAITSLDKLNSSYTGKISDTKDGLAYQGKLEIKTPDFVDFVNKLGFKYNPQYMSSILFTLKADLASDAKNLNITNLDAFVGTNNFTGDFSVVKGEIPQVTANINSNKIELDRFIPIIDQSKSKGMKKKISTDNVINFIEKPDLSEDKIDYSIFNGYELTGNFATDFLNITTDTFADAKAKVEIKQGQLKVSDFSGLYNNILLNSNFDITLGKKPTVKGTITIPEFALNKVGGKTYELIGGITTVNADFDASAVSEADFVKTLNGNLSLSIDNTIFKGWDIGAIETDLTYRTNSEELFEALSKNLSQGETSFYKVNVDFDIKDGKYNFVNSEMLTNGAKIAISGNGDITNWDTTTNFVLTIDSLKDKLPQVEYQWNGRINNPNLVILSNTLKEKYDTYWAQVYMEQEQAEQRRINALNERMSVAQESVQKALDTLAVDIFPRLNKYTPMSSNVTTKTKYDSSKSIADDIQNQLIEMQQRVNEAYTEDDVTQMNANLEVFGPQLEDMIRELDETYKIDIKNLSDVLYQTIKNVYDYSVQKGINYENTLNAYANRLIEIHSLVILDNEPNVADHKNNVETSLRAIADNHNKSIEVHNLIVNLDNIADLETQYNIMMEISNKSNSEKTNLNNSIRNLFEATKDLVAQEDEVAIRRLEAIKAAQEGQAIMEEEKKPKSKIIIIEEGQKPEDVAPIKPMVIEEPEVIEEPKIIETPAIIEEPKPVEKILNTEVSQPDVHSTKAENPFANIKTIEILEPDVPTEPITIPIPKILLERTSNTARKPAFEKTPVVEKSSTEVAKTVEKPQPEVSQITEDEEAEEEPVIVKQEPILKAVNTSAYRSKIVPSGIITKPATSKKQKKIVVNEESTPLLKPMTKKNVSSSGTITKRK